MVSACNDEIGEEKIHDIYIGHYDGSILFIFSYCEFSIYFMSMHSSSTGLERFLSM